MARIKVKGSVKQHITRYCSIPCIVQHIINLLNKDQQKDGRSDGTAKTSKDYPKIQKDLDKLDQWEDFSNMNINTLRMFKLQI